MSQQADFVAYNQDGQLLLIAEVRSRVATSKVWAARLRRNLLAHGFLPEVPFFLLALPDKFYLWKDARNTPEETEPTYELNATSLLNLYYEQGGATPETITKQSLALVLTAWLNTLTQIGVPNDVPQADRDTLIRSGMVAALKGGHIGFCTLT